MKQETEKSIQDIASILRGLAYGTLITLIVIIASRVYESYQSPDLPTTTGDMREVKYIFLQNRNDIHLYFYSTGHNDLNVIIQYDREKYNEVRPRYYNEHITLPDNFVLANKNFQARAYNIPWEINGTEYQLEIFWRKTCPKGGCKT